MGLQLTSMVQTAAGPFSFVIAPGGVTVGILNQGTSQIATGLQPAVSEPVTIVSQSGTQGETGAPGASGAPGSGVGGGPTFPDFYASDSATNEVVDESLCNFALYPTGTRTINFTCLAKVPGGGTGTVTVRLGGTDETIDGAVIATASITSASTYQTITAAGTFTNPGSPQLLKLTIQSSADGLDVLVKGVEVSIL